MQLGFGFAKSMAMKKVMYIRNGAVCSFASWYTFIDEEVYFLWNCFIANTKKSTFSWCFEINWARLIWVGWKMQLLCIVI